MCTVLVAVSELGSTCTIRKQEMQLAIEPCTLLMVYMYLPNINKCNRLLTI